MVGRNLSVERCSSSVTSVGSPSRRHATGAKRRSAGSARPSLTESGGVSPGRDQLARMDRDAAPRPRCMVSGRPSMVPGRPSGANGLPALIYAVAGCRTFALDGPICTAGCPGDPGGEYARAGREPAALPIRFRSAPTAGPALSGDRLSGRRGDREMRAPPTPWRALGDQWLLSRVALHG
jgi:hypothetical protein